MRNVCTISVCVCGQQATIDKLVQENQTLTSLCKKLKLMLKQSDMRCNRLTDSLNIKLLGNPHEDKFTEVEGFPDKAKLRRFSDAATSDFIFVRMLMQDLWPEGFILRTVTGRSTNNPRGRKGGKNDEAVEPSNKTSLEPEKLSYIEGKMLK